MPLLVHCLQPTCPALCLLSLPQLGGTIYPINIAWAAAFDDDLALRVRFWLLALQLARVAGCNAKAKAVGDCAAAPRVYSCACAAR